MSDKETLQSYNNKLSNNNLTLNNILNTINNLPEAGEGELEINNGYYLFYNNCRIDAINSLLPLCKNMTDTYFMFNNSYLLDVPIDLSNGQLDAITATNAYQNMFYNCNKIPSIKISSTSTKPASTSHMFQYCSSAKNIDISGLNTSKVTSMVNMFYGCSSLVSLPIGFTSLNTNLAREISNLFYNCSSLLEIDLSNMSFPAATSFASVFFGCKNARKILLPTNSNKTTNISNMFTGCDNLKEIDWSRFDTSKVTVMSSLFSGTSDSDETIEGTLDVDLSTLNLSSMTTMNNASQLLRYNRCVRTINLSSLNGKTFTGTSAEYWCQNATSLIELDLSPISLASSATSIRQMFDGCKRLKTINGFANFVTNATSLANGGQGVYRLFADCESLENIDLSTLKTSAITNGTQSNYYNQRGFCQMFYNCKNLKSLDISNFAINSSVNSLYAMFSGCSSLKSLLLPDFSTANITNLSNMFESVGTPNTVIDVVDKIDFTKATNMDYMFYNAAVKEIMLPVPDGTPNSKSYSTTHMFDGCTNITNIDAKTFGPNSSTSGAMQYMFANCKNLVSVDLSNYYNASYNTGMTSYMFQNCSSLKKVKFHHQSGHYIFSTDSTYPSTGLFDGCSSIEVIDLRYCMPKGNQMSYGNRLFANCRKLRKLDLRGSGYGSLGTSSSAWANGSNETLLNCGVDNPTPTIVYTDNTTYQTNLIALGNKFGLGWSTENVIVVEDPEQEVDMS